MPTSRTQLFQIAYSKGKNYASFTKIKIIKTSY